MHNFSITILFLMLSTSRQQNDNSLWHFTFNMEQLVLLETAHYNPVDLKGSKGGTRKFS